MKYVLSPAGQRELAEFSNAKVLVAFDFDGTLAPVVLEPSRAEMRAATRALFDRVAALYPCAVISGRARADVALRLNGAHVCAMAGNHGAELDASVAIAAPDVAEWRTAFATSLDGLAGVEVEDKRLSLSVHFRRAPNKREAESAILAAARALDGARIVLGKQVVNVVPVGAPHKGSALARIRADAGCTGAIYVGDDETDEDVFRDSPARNAPLFGIRVGKSARSHAGYYLRHQGEVDALLETLAGIRGPARVSR